MENGHSKIYIAYDMANGMTFIGYTDIKGNGIVLEEIVVTNTVPHIGVPGSEVLEVREYYKGIYKEVANKLDHNKLGREPNPKMEDKCLTKWYLGYDILKD